MAEFYSDFYQERREDIKAYAVGKKERIKRESIFEKEYLCRLFEERQDEDFSDILEKDKSWWTFYHLSEMRKGLFSWYEFKENARLLEVDADFGALTGLFCDRCADVVATESSIIKAKAIADRYKNRKNLKVYAGAVEDFDYTKFYGQFDYIVLYDVLERKGYGYSERKAYREYLGLMKSMLAQEGKILLVVTNRYGIRYICGARDRFTGKPFDGLNHYPMGTDAYAFEKGELENLLQESGFGNYKFFYPLPDARIPQMICTDGNFCAESISDRITFYDALEDTLVARERCLYQDFMRNGVFGYFANSFFVEIVQNESCSNVRYAIVSSDRGKTRSATTVVYENGTVRKKPMYRQGRQVTQMCAENIAALKKRGIGVVEHRVEKDCIVMPYVQGVTLAEELRKAVKEDIGRFYALFDLLYNDILKSSEYLEENFSEDVGPVLKECYFDMVPVNCFYINGKLQFFDQEFVRYNYPAKYIIYRAIKYMYMSMWEMENYVPKSKLIEKYGLADIWEEFEKTEETFIAAIRNKQVTGQLDQWSDTEEKKIYDRGNWLQLSEYNPEITETPQWLQKVQVIQLRLLKKLIEICEKHGLKYYAYYGTLLGTVRHQGVVPWDDDTDIVMPREDYDRFLTIASEELDDEFFLQTPLSDKECFYGGHSKLRYTSTTAIEVQNWGHDTNQGIGLDILPLDGIMDDTVKKTQFCDELHEVQRMILAKVYGENEMLLDMDAQLFTEYKEKAENFSYAELQNLLSEKLVSMAGEDQVTILASYHLGRYLSFPKKYFEPGIKMPFEDLQINVPYEYEKILIGLYGADYNSIPSVEKQVQKHEVFFDADISYKEYQHYFGDIYKEAESRKYIIVGTSELADTFIDKNHRQLHIAFVVDDDAEGDSFWGYPVKKTQDIYEIPAEERRVVICERFFRNSVRKLRQAGIDDYCIYIHDKWWLLGNNE